MRAFIMHFHPVFALLEDISACFVYQDILAEVQNLPHEKRKPVMHIMKDAITLIKEGVSSNTITQFEREPTLHYYFKKFYGRNCTTTKSSRELPRKPRQLAPAPKQPNRKPTSRPIFPLSRSQTGSTRVKGRRSRPTTTSQRRWVGLLQNQHE